MQHQHQTTLEVQIYMQYGLYLIIKPLNNGIVRNICCVMIWNFQDKNQRWHQKTHPQKTSHHQQSMVDQQWRQTRYWKEAASPSSKNKETTMKNLLQNTLRQVKIMVKQEIRIKELSNERRTCNHNPKCFNSYMNEPETLLKFMVGAR